MDKAHKAYYNSLRMSYLQDPTLPYEKWKVEDLTCVDTPSLFARLQKHNIYLDKNALLTYAEPFDTPEEFFEWLLRDQSAPEDVIDPIYLIVFELWRRLISDKSSISIFANDLDWMIYAYINDTLSNSRILESAIENLYGILVENVDEGMEPQEAFSALCEFFACDLESFLYTYMSDQIDQQDFQYAKELLDQFFSFAIDPQWFNCIKARLLATEDIGNANAILRQVFEQNKEEGSIDLDLDMLNQMVHSGDHALFLEICDHTLSLCDNEEDFIELLTLVSEYFRCLDHDEIHQKINALIKKRASKRGFHFVKDNPDCDLLRQIIGIRSLK